MIVPGDLEANDSSNENDGSQVVLSIHEESEATLPTLPTEHNPTKLGIFVTVVGGILLGFGISFLLLMSSKSFFLFLFPIVGVFILLGLVFALRAIWTIKPVAIQYLLLFIMLTTLTITVLGMVFSIYVLMFCLRGKCF